MAVTITDLRTLIDSADSLTGWTGSGYGLVTTEIVEASGAVAESLAIDVGEVYFTIAASGTVDVSDECVYVYAFNNALQTSWNAAPFPQAIILGDGTNRVAFAMSGTDRRVFNHLDGPTSWQCLVLDGAEAGTMDTAGDTDELVGTFASLDLTVITEIGVHFETGSKALGGGYNVAVDIMRRGNLGIRLTGGGVATETTFLEIAVADRATTTGTAHGVFRELTTGVYGCQSALVFGDDGAATDSRVIEDGVVLAFENRDIADDKYGITIEGHTSATNSFILTNSTISTGGPQAFFTCNSGFVNALTLTSVVFASLGGPFTFSTSADASRHYITFCSFQSAGTIATGLTDFEDNTVSASAQITYGGGTFLRNTVSAYTGAANTSALVWNENLDISTRLDGSSFTANGGTNSHAIEFGTSSPLTLNFTDVTFTGYNANNNVNASVVHIKRTTGTVTLNISGGTTPSYRSDGALVLVVNAVAIVITALDANTSALIEDARVSLEADTGGDLAAEKTTTITTATTTATATCTAHGMSSFQTAIIRGANEKELNGVKTITVTGANTFTYTITSIASAPGTGTITTTSQILDGETNVSGIVQELGFDFTTDQPFIGRLRKGTATPFYKTASITGTITSTGFSANVSMVPDE